MKPELLAELALARLAIKKMVAQQPNLKIYLTELTPRFKLVSVEIRAIDEAM